MKAIKEAEDEDHKEELRARKLAKKAEFDTAYDHGGGARAVDKGTPEDGEQGADSDAEASDDAQQKRKGQGWAR